MGQELKYYTMMKKLERGLRKQINIQKVRKMMEQNKKMD